MIRVMAAENSVDDVASWLERQGEAHFGDNAKLYKSAILRLSERRVEREPSTVSWVLENLEVLAERLAKAEHVAPNSLKTYISRARSALQAYADWSANPVGWSHKRGTSSGGGKKEKVATKVRGKASGAPPTPIPATPVAPGVERTIEDEISEALVAIARWPKLRPFLMKGLTEAMTGSVK